MKSQIFGAGIIAVILIGLSGCQNKGAGADPSSVELKSEEDKVFYAMGRMLGGNLARLDLKDQELAALTKGVYHAANNKESEVELTKYQGQIQGLFQKRIQKDVEAQKKIGQTYLEKFAKEDGVKKTESGMAYKILEEGEGKSPSPTDKVEVHYHGTLVDGTVFDSSVDRDKKITFALNQVIPGWTEGLQLMKEGGKAKFVIPSDLAYRDAGAQPKIPGGATLTFEVELFKVMDADTKTEANKANPAAPKEKAKKKS